MNVVPIQRDETEPDFSEFWRAYPRRVAKQAALKAWQKMNTEEKREAISVLPAHRLNWNGKEVEFLPHASTWLHGRRWEDELAVGTVQAQAECARCHGSLAGGFTKRREGLVCNRCERT